MLHNIGKFAESEYTQLEIISKIIQWMIQGFDTCLLTSLHQQGDQKPNVNRQIWIFT